MAEGCSVIRTVWGGAPEPRLTCVKAGACGLAHAARNATAPRASVSLIEPPPGTDRDWIRSAMALLRQEQARSADTHLLRVDLPAFPGILFYLKDEASHPTGSLKHRLARSLFLYALCNGRLHRG